ncbi:MAG TPA: OmpW family outer membrane protein [Phenylobacterium sp.]|nr:OmpW family outer membrane protein [Phenylobacterium sp.]
MAKSKIAALLVASVACGATAAHAQDSDRWFVKAGPAMVTQDENATFTMGGAPVPGANIKINPTYTIEAQVGYFVTNNVAIAFTGGLPPTARVHGDGTVAALGTLGQAVFGPMTLTARYQFNRQGRFQPYVGAGAAMLVIFKTKDGAVSDLKAKNDVGEAVEAGADYWITPNTGVYVDAKQTWLKTTTTGFLFGAPVVGKVRLNPEAYSVGVVHRF